MILFCCHISAEDFGAEVCARELCNAQCTDRLAGKTRLCVSKLWLCWVSRFYTGQCVRFYKVLNLLLSGTVQDFLDGCECGKSCCALSQVAVCCEVSS